MRELERKINELKQLILELKVSKKMTPHEQNWVIVGFILLCIAIFAWGKAIGAI